MYVLAFNASEAKSYATRRSHTVRKDWALVIVRVVYTRLRATVTGICVRRSLKCKINKFRYETRLRKLQPDYVTMNSIAARKTFETGQSLRRSNRNTKNPREI